MSVRDNINIIQTINEANNWLHNSALPLWFDKGIDWKAGGFFESLNFKDLSCVIEYKRVRVLARQIYVFAAAYRLGDKQARLAVSHGIAYLLDKYRLPSGGFASRVTSTGKIIEGPLDLYDLAFCLFALAHGYKLLGDNRLKDEALLLTQFISERFKHESVGYIESMPALIPRRQNPHMHFLEALLEWRQLSDNILFQDISNEIVALFFDKFYFSDSGTLVEYFDDHLKPIPGLRGEITEPGHHFEWIWLLDRYKDISGLSVHNHLGLYEFAHNYGFNNNTQLLWGEVTRSGALVKIPVRLWPHAEWIKAELVMNDVGDKPVRVKRAWRALARFLNCPQTGLWYESFDHVTNRFTEGPTPASSLYHIVLAIEALNKNQQAQNKTS